MVLEKSSTNLASIKKKVSSYALMDIMCPESQSYFHLSFIFIEMNFYLFSFLYDVYNEVHEHMI